MGCGQEGFRTPEGSQGQRTPVFDTIETALDEIAGFVEGFRIPGLLLAVFTGRDTGFGLAFAQPFTEVIRVIPAIGNHCCAFANNRLKALSCMGNVRFITSRNSDANWPTGTVTNQMQLAVQPTLR